MAKTILRVILVCLIGAMAWAGQRWFTQPTLIAPLTYTIEVDYGNKVDLAQEAHVLIIGDRLGESLNPYLKELIKRLSVKLKNPLRIVNWSAAKEGLNRSLHKLKALKKLPPVILYLGASQEFYEKRFNIKDRLKILSNVKKFRKENIATILYTLPITSKYIYSPIEFYHLTKKITKDPGDFTSRYQQKKMEIAFNLFDVELEEMIALSKEKGSYLILSSTPVNYEIAPVKVCANSTSNALEKYQREIEIDLENGKHKEMLKKIRELSETTIGNAKTFHLLGTASLGTGNYLQAKKAFLSAAAFDCGNTRSHPVFNALIQKKATVLGIKFIDFDNIISRHLGLNELFLGEHFPQEIYYQHYIDEVYDSIKTKLKL